MRSPLLLLPLLVLSGCALGELAPYADSDVLVAPSPQQFDEVDGWDETTYHSPIVVRLLLEDRDATFEYAPFLATPSENAEYLAEFGWETADVEAGEVWKYETGCDGLQTRDGNPDVPAMFWRVDC